MDTHAKQTNSDFSSIQVWDLINFDQLYILSEIFKRFFSHFRLLCPLGSTLDKVDISPGPHGTWPATKTLHRCHGTNRVEGLGRGRGVARAGVTWGNWNKGDLEQKMLLSLAYLKAAVAGHLVVLDGLQRLAFGNLYAALGGQRPVTSPEKVKWLRQNEHQESEIILE